MLMDYSTKCTVAVVNELRKLFENNLTAQIKNIKDQTMFSSHMYNSQKKFN